MLWIFQEAVARLKALLIADVALDLEGQFLARHADRKASLLEQAEQYEQQGLAELAAEVRGQVYQFVIDRPLAWVHPVFGTPPSEAGDRRSIPEAGDAPPRLAARSTDSANGASSARKRSAPAPRKRKARPAASNP